MFYIEILPFNLKNQNLFTLINFVIFFIALIIKNLHMLSTLCG